MSRPHYSRETGGYDGTREWAQRHATRLQGLVGTIQHGELVSRVLAEPYGTSTRRWAVARYWRYAINPSLGEFGGNYLWLPYD